MPDEPRKPKSSPAVSPSGDRWEAQPSKAALPPPPLAPEESEARKRRPTTPFMNHEPAPRTTVPVEKADLVAQQVSVIKTLKEKLENARKQMRDMNTFNEELVATNIESKMRIEELEVQVKSHNERAMNLAAVISKKEIGCEDTQKFATAVMNLARTFQESDPKKVVALLGNDCPGLLDALIDTVSQVKS